jgi:hypothetical protein
MAASSFSWRKRGFTTRQAADYIGRSPSWLRKKRLRGVEDPGDPGPRYLKTETGSVIYLVEHLDEYLDQLAAQSGKGAVVTADQQPRSAA